MCKMDVGNGYIDASDDFGDKKCWWTIFHFAVLVTFIPFQLRIYIMLLKYHTQDVITTYNQHQATVMLADCDVGDTVMLET